MASTNPRLGKRGGDPETGILPRSRGGAASVTTNPTNGGQTDRLQQYLFTKSRQQYEDNLRRLAARYGVEPVGRVTDPMALFTLRQRAAFAADSITRTYAAQMQQAQDNGGTLSDLVQSRNGYKPDQIWITELNTADQMAFRDFFDNHGELRAQQAAHVEPPDAKEDLCQSYIDMGSVPMDQLPVDFPLHVGCPHGWMPDDPAPDTTMIPGGTVTNDGGYIPEDVPVQDATASLLSSVGWWLAGLGIASAMGDRKKDQQPPQQDQEQ